MKKLFIPLMLLASVFTSCAQTKCTIKKAYAFYTVSTPGAQMTDDNGNPVPPKLNIARYIYFEWCGTSKPEIDSVLYNNKALTATLTAIAGKTIIPGNYPGHNSEYKITAKNCKSLWQLDLQAVAGNEMPAPGCKNIIIKTKTGNKTCMFRLVKETQLSTMPRY